MVVRRQKGEGERERKKVDGILVIVGFPFLCVLIIIMCVTVLNWLTSWVCVQTVLTAGKPENGVTLPWHFTLCIEHPGIHPR